MIYDKILKVKILKQEIKLYDLGGQELIDLQKSKIKVVQKILDKQYKDTLKALESNSEIVINDLIVDQKQFIDKDFQTSIQEFIDMIVPAFKIGLEALDDLMKEEVEVPANFGLTVEEINAYAEEYSANMVTNIDNYTRDRINKLVTDGIEKGWGYRKIADELRKDYGFSNYRASLIASNEIGNAYIVGKDMQFDKYRSEYGQTGWKNWISHRDERTTSPCLKNDKQGWIEKDQEFQSGHMIPLEHIGCRCNTMYRLFNPNEN